jgi:hypothetical protein
MKNVHVSVLFIKNIKEIYGCVFFLFMLDNINNYFNNNNNNYYDNYT